MVSMESLDYEVFVYLDYGFDDVQVNVVVVVLVDFVEKCIEVVFFVLFVLFGFVFFEMFL